MDSYDSNDDNIPPPEDSWDSYDDNKPPEDSYEFPPYEDEPPYGDYPDYDDNVCTRFYGALGELQHVCEDVMKFHWRSDDPMCQPMPDGGDIYIPFDICCKFTCENLPKSQCEMNMYLCELTDEDECIDREGDWEDGDDWPYYGDDSSTYGDDDSDNYYYYGDDNNTYYGDDDNNYYGDDDNNYNYYGDDDNTYYGDDGNYAYDPWYSNLAGFFH